MSYTNEVHKPELMFIYLSHKQYIGFPKIIMHVKWLLLAMPSCMHGWTVQGKAYLVHVMWDVCPTLKEIKMEQKLAIGVY